MFDRIKAWFRSDEQAGGLSILTALPSQAALDAMSVDELNALNQAMGREQDAIRDKRKVIARTVDRKITGG